MKRYETKRMNKMRHQEVDWAGLNPDLLCIIVKKLGDISSFFRFRTVCKAWKSATYQADPPRELPWIYNQHCVERDCKSMDFYSISTNKLYTIPFPEAHFDKNIFKASYNGYVITGVLSDQHKCPYGSRLVFLNPLTWDEVSLPNSGEDTYISCIFLCKTIENSNFLLVGMEYKKNDYNSLNFLYLRQGENKKWTKIKFPLLKFPHTLAKTIFAYWKQRFFVYQQDNKNMEVIHATTGDALSTIPFPHEINHLVSTGDCLLAVREIVHYIKPSCLEDFQFEVYRLENFEENPHWIKLSGIGDIMLFLDQTKGFSLMASDFDGVRGNCIYFISNVWKDQGSIRIRAVGRFDMGENKCEEVPLPSEFGPKHSRAITWFTPNLNIF